MCACSYFFLKPHRRPAACVFIPAEVVRVVVPEHGHRRERVVLNVSQCGTNLKEKEQVDYIHREQQYEASKALRASQSSLATPTYLHSKVGWLHVRTRR